eukprot:11175770-Lingulodinium_polyedra.AAC.1
MAARHPAELYCRWCRARARVELSTACWALAPREESPCRTADAVRSVQARPQPLRLAALGAKRA